MSNGDPVGNRTGTASDFSLKGLAEGWVVLCDAWDSLLDQGRREGGATVFTHGEPGLGMSAVGDVMLAVTAVRDACVLPDFVSLLAPLAALQWYGPSQVVESQIRALRDGAKAIEDLRGRPGSRRKPSSESLRAYADECASLLSDLQLAKEYVERFGLRINAKSPMPSLIRQRGKPAHLYTAIVGAVFEQVSPKVRVTTREVEWNSKPNREKISHLLSSLFSSELTDPKRRGPLEWALGDYLKNRGRYRLSEFIPREFRGTIPIPRQILERLSPSVSSALADLAGIIPP